MRLLGTVLRIATSLPVLCVALLGLLIWFTLAVRARAQRVSQDAVPAQALRPRTAVPGAVKEIGAKAVALAVPPPAPPEPPKEIPADVRRTLLAIPAPLGLYSAAPAPPAPPPPPVSERYLPYGTLIPCKLVNAIDSTSEGTPVVAVVLEDMHNRDVTGTSQLVIPAGTLAVLDSTAAGRERDRIAADGLWRLVWRTRDEDNGLELPVAARALMRDFDPVTGLYGEKDGRAGLRGEVVESPEARRLGAATQAFIQGGLAAAKEYDVSSNALGQTLRNPLPSLRNALLGGAESYVQRYADDLRQRLERDIVYVRVAAGTEFYLFPKQTVDFRQARRGSHEPAHPAP